MQRLAKWLLSVVILAISVGTVQAHRYDKDLAEVIKEADSVQNAVDLVQDALERKGYEIVLTVNHAAAALSVGLELRPTQLIFARPPAYIESALLRRSQTVGIDLPIKILVFEDEDGLIQSRRNPTGYLVDRHSITLHDHVLQKLERVTERFVMPDNGLITISSEQSMDDTVLALQDAIGATGAFRIPLVLDYGEGRHRNKPVLIVFGNPNAGTPLMQSSQEIALDLPQKFLVWEDRFREVHITYNDPFFIAKRHNVQGQDERLGNISNALANLATAGAGK